MNRGQILQTGSVRELAQAIGDREVITLRGAFTAQQVQHCLEHAPVSIVSAVDQCVTIYLTDEKFGLAPLVAQLAAAGIALADLSMQKPTLESVFLKLTGRALRD